MRIRIRRELLKGARRLMVTLRAYEYSRAKRVAYVRKASGKTVLLPTGPARVRFGRARFAYDVTGMRPLGRHARRFRPSGTMVLGWCEDLLAAMTLLTQADVPHTALVLNPRFVFVTEDLRLRFVCAPIEDERLLESHSPLSLLECWCAASERGRKSPCDCFVTQQLSEYVREEGETLSLNRFRSFVQRCAEACEQLGDTIRWVLEFGDASCTPVCLEEGASYLIGREEECDVCISGHPRLSRRHVTVCCKQSAALVTDLGSTNGTVVCGRALRPFESAVVAPGEPFELAGVLVCRVLRRGALCNGK